MTTVEFTVEMTITQKYSVPLQAYPEGSSLEEIIALEQESFKSIPEQIFEDGSADIKVTITY